MPLDILKTYVKTHKHLPNLPDEEEIVGEGIDLGEMSILLTEKIEELILYTIEQNDQINELKQEIDHLKVVISEIQTSE